MQRLIPFQNQTNKPSIHQTSVGPAYKIDDSLSPPSSSLFSFPKTFIFPHPPSVLRLHLLHQEFNGLKRAAEKEEEKRGGREEEGEEGSCCNRKQMQQFTSRLQ